MSVGRVARVATESNIDIDSSMSDHRILTVNLVLNGTRPHRGSNSKGPADKTSIKRMPEEFMLDTDTVDRLDALSYML